MGKIDDEQHIQSISPSSVNSHGQTESGPPVLSPIELQQTPGLTSLQLENEATLISTRLEQLLIIVPLSVKIVIQIGLEDKKQLSERHLIVQPL